MVRKFFSFTTLLLFLVIFNGCTTLEDAKSAKGTGEFRVYDASQDRVWTELHNVMNGFGLNYVDENKKEGYIYAKRNVTAMSYGESVAIYLSAVSSEKTRVEIISIKKMKTNLFAPNWAPKIFKVLDGVFIPKIEN